MKLDLTFIMGHVLQRCRIWSIWIRYGAYGLNNRRNPWEKYTFFPPLIDIHLVNVGIFEDEIDDSEEKAVGGQEQHEQPVGAAGRLTELKQTE